MAYTSNPITLTASIERQGSLKNCSNCGRRFGCGINDIACWCSEVPRIAVQMINADRDCMCPECLNALLDAQ